MLLGGAICGFGVAALLLSLPLDDGADDPALPPLVAVSAVQDAEPAPARARPEWPALFGVDIPEPEPEPEPEPIEEEWEEPEPKEPLDARLKGVAQDEAGGWALIEIDDTVVLVRPGSMLTPEHQVVEILIDAVVIESSDGTVRLGFDDSEADEPVAARVSGSPARALLAGRHDFDDMPMPLPPEDYRPGPGFSGPVNH